LVDGYGPVAFSMFLGFFVGMYFQKNHVFAGISSILLFIGYVVAIAAIAKIGSLNGPAGGFILGFGLGYQTGQYFPNL
jgi:hypothetical protein